MKWRMVKGDYLWHYSNSLSHHCIIYTNGIFKLSNKYYPKERFNDYPNDKTQKQITELFFKKKIHSGLIDYIFTIL